MLIEADNAALPIYRQCELLGLSRATYYYQPAETSAEDLRLMRLLDEQYTATPFYGSRRMVVQLWKQGHQVNRKRVQRLMRLLGLEAIYPKPRLSAPGEEHRVYPYLLRDLTIERPNQVWCTDITYIRMPRGFCYLVAILDWYSRYVLAWALSNTLETSFCLEALEQALRRSHCEIFNTDQGSQFTSAEFTGKLLAAGIRISMDGRGRVFDNIFIERLWRSVKYEEVYLKDYGSVNESRQGLGNYFQFYNEERPHQALAYRTPSEVYHGWN